MHFLAITKIKIIIQTSAGGCAVTMSDNNFLPRFCSPLPTTIPDADLAAAVAERAFLCLPEEMVDIILRRYVDFIHPQIPVLCLDTLLAVFEKSSEKRLSILLWQALATAVIPFFTDSELGVIGLVSTTKAVSTYLNRTTVGLPPCSRAKQLFSMY